MKWFPFVLAIDPLYSDYLSFIGIKCTRPHQNPPEVNIFVDHSNRRIVVISTILKMLPVNRKKNSFKTESEIDRSSDKISIDELRSFPGFESISDKEATDIITSLYQLSRIGYQVILEEQNRRVSKTKSEDKE